VIDSELLTVLIRATACLFYLVNTDDFDLLIKEFIAYGHEHEVIKADAAFKQASENKIGERLSRALAGIAAMKAAASDDK
jgi:hypothetical protein